MEALIQGKMRALCRVEDIPDNGAKGSKPSSPWQLVAINAKLRLMDTVNPPQVDSVDVPPDTEADRQHRLSREAEGIARARDSIAAGYYATSTEVNAWIDSLGSDNPSPVPYPRHPRPR